MSKERIVSSLQNGSTALGIEFGSTRIKAVLIDHTHTPIASGSHTWESRYENGVWTYALDDVWAGLRSCYAELSEQVFQRYGVRLKTVGSIGISAMMHGYLPLDAEGRQLAEFRTWRNTITAGAAARLTELFRYNIPQRWSVAHLYHAILNGEAHVRELRFLTTLSGYVHWKLTGEKVLGIGDASGMFPIDSRSGSYDAAMLQSFRRITAAAGLPWTLEELLPHVLQAGQPAGRLTEAGAHLIDPTGTLRAGIPLCPPEGDAGTGMVATNAVSVRTGNISAGTSIFAMVVLEHPLTRPHPEIDLVCTPAGRPAAMVQCNNGTPEMDAWIRLFRELADVMGAQLPDSELFPRLYQKALEGEPDCGGLVLFNYLSGEHMTGIASGRPLLVRTPDSRLSLSNFMRAHLCSLLASLRIGLEILEQEQVAIDTLMGHGGLFKTPEVGQRLAAAAARCTVAVMDTAAEGGPWGNALLASYLQRTREYRSLEDYLSRAVFAGRAVTRLPPDPVDAAGFDAFLARYRSALPVEQCAERCLR